MTCFSHQSHSSVLPAEKSRTPVWGYSGEFSSVSLFIFSTSAIHCHDHIPLLGLGRLVAEIFPLCFLTQWSCWLHSECWVACFHQLHTLPILPRDCLPSDPALFPCLREINDFYRFDSFTVKVHFGQYGIHSAEAIVVSNHVGIRCLQIGPKWLRARVAFMFLSFKHSSSCPRSITLTWSLKQ